MCLAFNGRKSTKDVDAVFSPASTIRKIAAEVGKLHGIDEDWLNDAAKGFLEGTFKRNDLLNYSHLRVWVPEPKYMLAMKCLSARWDTLDRKDVIFLLELLQLKSAPSVFAIIESYYPKKRILPKTQFFIEEIFEGRDRKKRR